MMSNRISAKIHVPLLCGLFLLHGCGGGGGSSDPKPQGSSAAGSSLAITSSSSGVTTSVLTLNGQVEADSLADATLVLNAGTQSFNAALTNGKNYQVKLDVEQKNKSIPIVVTVKGGLIKPRVEFVSLLPSAEHLASLAGSDNAVDQNEFSGLSITALTTAEYAEIKNNNWPLTSDAERKQALANLHPVRAVEQAAMLTQLLPDVGGTLPGGKQTTLDYLLDANLAEAHLETLRITNESELNKNINDLQASILNVSAKNVAGNFALEGRLSHYLLTLNADGTGNIKTNSINTDILSGGDTPKVNTNITWIRDQAKVTISFIDSVIYQTNGFDDENGVKQNCDSSLTSKVELCDVTFNSMQLDLVSESDIRHIASLKLMVNAIKQSDSSSLYQGALLPQVVRLINLDATANVVVSDLVGEEWIGRDYSFTLSADGKAVQKYLFDNTTQTVDWILTGNRLEVGDMHIWIGARNEGGFTTFFSGNNSVYRDALFKRATVSMTESDWVGRWSFYPADVSNNPYDVNADKTWRDGLEAKSQGSWVRVDEHRQAAIANASWRMERDVVAIHNGKYYLSICQGADFTPFIPQNCYLSIQSKSADFSSAAFWNSWSNPVFQENASGAVWMTGFGRVIESSTNSSSYFGNQFYKVSSNRLYLPRLNSFIEITKASKDEIELCEYFYGGSCNPLKKRKYTAGVEVKLTVGSGGVVKQLLDLYEPLNDFVTHERMVDKVMMAPKNRAFALRIEPNMGRSISSVTGCNGILWEGRYAIPALTEACEVVVKF
ncbi:MAG: hypothetical protein AAGC78_18560 [Cellvibrio sp.]|uniref:hypothetical protein n=1 Tax=Cellvibrio sp. TaxID=1965322 RepID=UPI0031A919D8